MNYKKVEKAAFKVCGISMLASMKENKIPEFWAESYQNGTTNKILSLNPDKYLLGICYDMIGEDEFSYMIGIEAGENIPADMEVIDIPAATWLVFECIGAMPHAIHKLWGEVWEFLSTGEYDHAKMPDFELYYNGDVTKDDYRSEIWIPVINK